MKSLALKKGRVFGISVIHFAEYFDRTRPYREHSEIELVICRTEIHYIRQLRLRKPTVITQRRQINTFLTVLRHKYFLEKRKGVQDNKGTV